MKDPNVFEVSTSYDDVHIEVLKLTKNYSGRYLDLGVGQGRLTAKLIAQGHSDIYACDKHPEYFILNKIKCIRCDLNHEALPYEGDFFDVVVCTDVIEHLENPRGLLRQIQRVLKTKGKLILSTPNHLSLRARLSFLFRGYSCYFEKLKVSRHITFLTKFDLLVIFKEVGFAPLKITYTKGIIPKTRIHWQTPFPFLRGDLLSDTVIVLGEKL